MKKMGIEIEMPGIVPEALSILNAKGFYKFCYHDDGSCREYAGCVDGLPMFTKDTNIVGWGSSRYVGVELVTQPLCIKEAIEFSNMFKKCFGHLPKKSTAGIHIHMDVTDIPWVFVQNLLLWFYKLEAVLYRLSCAGTRHRGSRKSSDYMFCRPISNPIGIGQSNNPYTRIPVVDIDSLIEAKTATELVAAWGRMDLLWSNANARHYTARRLMGINPYSIKERGTLELRIFDPLYNHLPDFVNLAIAFYNLRYKRPDLDVVYTLGSTPDLTKTDVESILNMPISDSFWGKNWQIGCRDSCKTSHYNTTEYLNRSASLNTIVNNGSMEDDGSARFPLYTSYSIDDTYTEEE